MEFTISTKEINRRKTANLIVTFSLTVGFFLGLFKLWQSNLPQVLIFTVCFFAALWIVRLLSLRVLSRHLVTRIVLDEDSIRRITREKDETIRYEDLSRVHILMTTRGEVRHVKFIIGRERVMVLNGLDNFRKFVQQLKSQVPNIPIKETHEPLDYDHPLFYYILGPVVGFTVTFAVLSVSYLNATGLAIVTDIFAGLTVCLGIYFLFGLPLKKWYGKKSLSGDIFIGLLLIIAGIMLLII